MTVPTNRRSSSSSPSSEASGPGKEGQSNTSNRPPAHTSSQTSQSDGHTESIVEGDWVAILPSSVAGSEAPGDLSAMANEVHDTTSRAGSADRGMDDSGTQGGMKGTEVRRTLCVRMRS
ncbi:hypothetical protein KC336_g9111 [Hortaea werneckii]|nr:hypothetical protein KC336_g9111 [Hortaea werneckii]